MITRIFSCEAFDASWQMKIQNNSVTTKKTKDTIKSVQKSYGADAPHSVL
jgi:hypothetical protein